ncbi:hypothetical protein GB931_18005 [Modestobacter sp. I12A-02628]|uniref:Uncharacterized protein n=1 Tax=Goekera deserti TaxID=2497753 RepID=A0A7K3W7Z8_9ACTN|nr:hypothetical protein [Goekera deserti]MPQ99776.1 hypothetical protein [Goekera deserti]NDI49535.1 hypothetical protein [Goekera deserti]NEL52591.1 hypothetical protein [Goekera deserti]
MDDDAAPGASPPALADGRDRWPSAPLLGAGLVVFGAAGLGLAAIGGWVGLGLVLLLAAGAIALVVAAC